MLEIFKITILTKSMIKPQLIRFIKLDKSNIINSDNYIVNIQFFKFKEKKTMLNQQYDFIFKILLIGHTAVGKSSLLLRFAENTFQQSFLPTIGVDFKIKTIDHQGSIIKLQMWDTAGQQKFKTIVSSYYKNAHGIILVYDVTDKNSFKDVQNWMDQVEKFAPKNSLKILVGNKMDLYNERQVSSEQGRIFAESMGMKFIETSVKNNINVETAFNTLVSQIKCNLPKKPQPKTVIYPININDRQKNKKKQKITCC